MKWSLISIAVIVLSVGSISAHEYDSEFCELQRINQFDVQEKCIDKLVNRTKYEGDGERAIVEYSGDDAAVLEFAKNYCPYSISMVNCSAIVNTPKECYEPQYYYRHYIKFRIEGVMATFLCANNGEAMLELAPNGGLATIMVGDTTACWDALKEVDVVSTLGENIEINQVTLLYCDVIGRIAECYISAVQSEANKNLPRVLNGIFGKIRENLGCQ